MRPRLFQCLVHYLLNTGLPVSYTLKMKKLHLKYWLKEQQRAKSCVMHRRSCCEAMGYPSAPSAPMVRVQTLRGPAPILSPGFKKSSSGQDVTYRPEACQRVQLESCFVVSPLSFWPLLTISCSTPKESGSKAQQGMQRLEGHVRMRNVSSEKSF